MPNTSSADRPRMRYHGGAREAMVLGMVRKAWSSARLVFVSTTRPCLTRSIEPPTFRHIHSGASSTVPKYRSHRGSCLRRAGFRQAHNESTHERLVTIAIDGTSHAFSPVLLRDLDQSPQSVDVSTKQKLFSTSDIPSDVRARQITQDDSGVTIEWDPQSSPSVLSHSSRISWSTLRSLARSGATDAATSSLTDRTERRLWDNAAFSGVTDIQYEAYMHEEGVLLTALQQLHTFGLLFLVNVPDSEDSVSAIAERIGPVKNTFYGYTWDVRSVPEARNVAYTSQDLGFHMDLLYMQQPPHLQFLHCIRSSTAGGASLFTDAYKSAQDLLVEASDAFTTLALRDVNFHYDHPDAHLYRQSRRVFELDLERIHDSTLGDTDQLTDLVDSCLKGRLDIADALAAVSWSPPFQAPFAVIPSREAQTSPQLSAQSTIAALNRHVEEWHDAASRFSALIHRPHAVHERMMGPGECVIFDNRRVLHARRAFEVGDMGTERWLRGAYLDKDPYMSRLKVLEHRRRGFA